MLGLLRLLRSSEKLHSHSEQANYNLENALFENTSIFHVTIQIRGGVIFKDRICFWLFHFSALPIKSLPTVKNLSKAKSVKLP